MKKTDVAMIVFIASISILIAYFVGKALFGDVYDGSTKVKTIDKIDSSIVEPDPAIFNTNAINPAVQVQVTGTDSGGTGAADVKKDQ
ncbi:MAG TPA: hypothetical protein PLZ58_01565 [Candidatus Saccharibacteria bacterium]|nr:hypothetical protein [Candidatus Saccharibacteria bacterium]HRQ06993.1 hypothetical protein [Candidatus Saccharibacteria bacterium]